jgi:mycoketide-CoA synthase
VKSNIGHTQAAAGVTGVIKMVEALRHGILPATLHVDAPSPLVDWSAGEVALLTERQHWRRATGPRRAGISSFGASGTNAHVIVEEPPRPARSARPPIQDNRPRIQDDPPVLAGSPSSHNGSPQTPRTYRGTPRRTIAWVLSARSDDALRAQAQRLIAALEREPQLTPEDVGLSLAMRTSFEERAVVMGEDRETLLGALGDAAHGRAPKNVIRGARSSAGERKPVFLFPGQGSQWSGMAVGLLDRSPRFAQEMRSCAQALAPHVDWSLEDVLRAAPGAPGLERVDVVQPALFAVMVSLAALWQACGVKPACVVGHSQGEIAAAHVAGGLSLEDAARIVALRSRLLATIAGCGGMVSVALSAPKVQALLHDFTGTSIAAVNGPSQTVVSGNEEALKALLDACQENDVDARRIPVDYASHSPQIETLEDALLDACASITPRSGEVPFFSTVDGAILDTSKLDSAYWYRNLRETVQFQTVIQGLLKERYRAFIEISPHPVLSVGLAATVEQALQDPAEALIASSLRRDEGDPERFCASLAQAWVRGVAIDWESLLAEMGSRHVQLPTYPFQRERSWIEPTTQAGGITAAGQTPTRHPLLSATIALPDGGQLFTGRVCTHTHPWLADHAVIGNVLLPATAFLELALHAGEHLGCPRIIELVVHAPLILPVQGAVQLRLMLSAPDASSTRQLQIHARSEPHAEEVAGQPWTHHATGLLAASRKQQEEGASPRAAWPPSNAQPIDLGDLYDRLAEHGLEYGPAFQGLHAAWRDGEDVLAEIVLASEQQPQATNYTVHPALLDAALHASELLNVEDRADHKQETRLPFAWGEVEFHAHAGSALRVRVSKAPDDTISLTATDTDGALLATIDTLSLRALSREQLANATRAQTLYTLDWHPAHTTAATSSPEAWVLLRVGASALERELGASALTTEAHEDFAALVQAIDAAGRPPKLVLADCRQIAAATNQSTANSTSAQSDDSTDLASAARASVRRTLELLQAWIAEERLLDTRLILVTQNAQATNADEDVADLAAAPIWGLVRAAQAETPGRFVLFDVDEHPDWGMLADALSLEEPQLALRAGTLLVPRLTHASSAERVLGQATGACESGTVLITGGTGGMGAQLARHLVEEHGVRHLILASRSGPAAAGALELEDELERLGASTTIAVCDASSRDALARLIAEIPAAAPLKGIIHAAGVLDDGIVASLDVEQVERVLASKLTAAAHLHELTAELDLDMFVLCSSIAATLGSAGQANYAAANAFLDALAAHRRANGCPATSIAWGLWTQDSGMTVALEGTDRERLARTGVGVLSSSEALEVFDRARAARQAHLIGARLDMASLRAQARIGLLSPTLRGIVRIPEPQAQSDGSLARRLRGMTELERERTVLGFVRAHAATVLGHGAMAALPDRQPWRDLGLDSLAAVELSNRLAAQTGVRLATTTVFAHPTPIELAKHLARELVGGTTHVASAHAKADGGGLVAVVGMGCRLPGGVGSPGELWDLVVGGGDAIGGFPSDRGWDLSGLFHPDPDRAGACYVSEGGFLEEAGGFDASFFSISPREALAMDPQQRLMLEVAWEALEHAGIDPLSLRASATAVYAGAMASDYTAPMTPLPSDLERYRGPGNATSVLSGRVSYALDLAGEAVSVDCACSSSLVAIHQACRALQSGECSLAISGGVTVMATADTFVQFSRQRGLAPNGRCKSFAQTADGASFAEGAGVLVLERLSDALAAGHEVLAVVRGSAVNQDGASNGLTAPNGPAQEQVIRQALANAEISPAEVDVVEAHGTGTTLGDPIEAGALIATYGQDRERPLWLGSVKSNIGHTQAAAGVTGVIKMVEALRHGILPATLHVDRPSGHVDWSAGEVRLLTEQRPWEETGRPRRAGISSFGLSGTNAHLILEQAPPRSAASTETDRQDTVLGAVGWVLSGREEGALRAQAARMRDHIERDPGLGVLDVGLSLASRSQLEWRAVLVGDSREQLLHGLGALAGAQRADRAVVGRVGDIEDGRAVFLFGGQGSQWQGMAVGLLDGSSLFASHLRTCEDALAEHVDWSLEAVLRGQPGAPPLDRVDVVQPTLFAVMVALARLWQACGAQPAAVVGHSQGEIAAAHIAGGLSLEDAARIVALRSRSLSSIAGQGGMLAVAQSATLLAESLERYEQPIAIAAINGPLSTVLSGPLDALDAFAAQCESEAIRTRRIPVDYPSHSSAIEEIRVELLDACAAITPRRGEIPFYSTVTAGELDTERLDGEYWYRNLRDPVRFEPAIRSLLDQGHRAFIEVSPHPVLAQGVAETIEQHLEDPTQALIGGSLRREEGSPQRFCVSLAQAWVRGVDVDWAAIFEATGAKRVSLPTYAFQRERYWLNQSTPTGDLSAAGLTPVNHPLLSAAIELDNGAWLFTGRLSEQTHPWLADHAVLGHVLLPATCFLELALHAAAHVGAQQVAELAIRTPLMLPPGQAVHLQIALGAPIEDGQRTIDIRARREAAPGEPLEQWTLHASGLLGAHAASTSAHIAASTSAPALWPPAQAAPIDITGFYDKLAEHGIHYGPAFQGLCAAWHEGEGEGEGEGEEIFAEIALPGKQEQAGLGYTIHPALFDAALQTMALLPGSQSPGGQFPIRLPMTFTAVSANRHGTTRLRVRLRLNPLEHASATHTEQADQIRVLLSVSDLDGSPVATIESLLARAISREQITRLGSDHDRPALPDTSSRRSLASRLAGVHPDERATATLVLVCEEVTSVLGRPADEGLDVTRPLKDLGLHSAQALELRDRLQNATALRLPASFAFDHPSAGEMAHELAVRLEGELRPPADPTDALLDTLQSLVEDPRADEGQRGRVATRLEGLLANLATAQMSARGDSGGLGHATDRELLAIIDGKRGA